MEKPWLKHYEPGVPAALEYPASPVHRLLEDAALRYPRQVAALFPGRLGDGYRLTYRALDGLANRMANALLSLGIEKGDRVALLLPNSPQFMIGYFGALKAGATVVAANPLYITPPPKVQATRELIHTLEDSGAKALVVLSRFYPAVAGMRGQGALRHLIVTNIKDYLPQPSRMLYTLLRERKEGDRVELGRSEGLHTLSRLLREHPAKAPAVSVGPDDVALLQYTGGTTGLPKAAVLTHRNIVAEVAQLRAWLPGAQEGRERFLAVMPFFHIYGMAVVLCLGIHLGDTLVLAPRFEVANILKLIGRYKPTYFHGVPTMYVAINNHPQTPRHDLRSIKVCLSGGAPLPLEVQEKFEALTGARLVEGYGLSESTGASHCNPIFGSRKIGTIGVPLPDVECRLVDLETGQNDAPLGEPGELILRGPQVMAEYWNRPQETAATLRNGWLYTGDIARVDPDGFFTIVDRKKEMIIAGGYNIYPREVEEVLFEHPKVREAAVIGIPDAYRGETVKALVVLKEGQSATPEELVAFCRGKLARYKVPTAIEFRQELPKSAIGKVLRRVLMEEERQRLAAKKP
ncbi:MAG: long-chain fatty acid--CoA ligase [Chloroflexi bacterium]|nr:long-chain fatty acid--CoA ligase [Chloroflexota bacterium]